MDYVYNLTGYWDDLYRDAGFICVLFLSCNSEREHRHRYLVTHAIDLYDCSCAHDLLDEAGRLTITFVDPNSVAYAEAHAHGFCVSFAT